MGESKLVPNSFRTSFGRMVGARDSKYLFSFTPYEYFILVNLYYFEIRQSWERERLARTAWLVLFCRQDAACRPPGMLTYRHAAGRTHGVQETAPGHPCLAPT